MSAYLPHYPESVCFSPFSSPYSSSAPTLSHPDQYSSLSLVPHPTLAPHRLLPRQQPEGTCAHLSQVTSLCSDSSVVPTFLRVQVLPMAHKALHDLSYHHPLLTSTPPSTAVFQSHGPFSFPKQQAWSCLMDFALAVPSAWNSLPLFFS